MKNIPRQPLALCALLLCAQFSMDQDESSVSGGSKKPAVNFTGTIIDNTGKPFKASHINISGLYKQIPVYSQPTNMNDAEYNPTINMIRLDLSEIAKIEVPDPDRVHTFTERRYIILNVYLNNEPQKKHSYIIEDSKRVFCSQVNGSDPIERELAFPAIRVIQIKGYVKKEIKPDTIPVKDKPVSRNVHPSKSHLQPRNLPPKPPRAVDHRAPVQHRKLAPAA